MAFQQQKPGFWKRMEGAAKWITAPKQILTGVGFALDGPLGAAAGRTAGGAIPQPWGDRPSSVEGKGDLGRLLKDAATGYGAGVVGQQIPGIQNLEGAFAGAAAPGYGVMPMTGGPGGLSPAAQAAWHQQLGSAATSAPTSFPALTPMAQEAGSMPPWMQQAMERSKQPGGALANVGQSQRALETSAAEINARFGGQAGVKRALGEGSGSVIDKIGDKVGGFWGDLDSKKLIWPRRLCRQSQKLFRDHEMPGPRVVPSYLHGNTLGTRKAELPEALATGRGEDKHGSL